MADQAASDQELDSAAELPPTMRAFVLFGFDRSTCQATMPIAALVVPEIGPPSLSWLPLRLGADEPWRARLASREVGWPEALVLWAEASSPAVELREVAVPDGEPRAAAEALVDELLNGSLPETAGDG